MRTGRPSRLHGFDYLGLHRYSLTFVLTEFVRTARIEEFAIIAYCFMPDHVHLLVEALSETSDGRRFIIRSKQRSAHAYAAQFKARLWQPNGFEHVLRDDEKTRVVARYILENPVRAGLVPSPLDYPFLGSEIYTVRDLIEGLY